MPDWLTLGKVQRRISEHDYRLRNVKHLSKFFLFCFSYLFIYFRWISGSGFLTVMAKTAGGHILLWQKNVECYPTALILPSSHLCMRTGSRRIHRQALSNVHVNACMHTNTHTHTNLGQILALHFFFFFFTANVNLNVYNWETEHLTDAAGRDDPHFLAAASQRSGCFQPYKEKKTAVSLAV